MFDDFSFAPVHIDAPVQPVLLPHVPSKLLRLALDDLLKVEGMPDRYRVDMMVYHSPWPNYTVCSVCQAGAVMAMTLGSKKSAVLRPADFGQHNAAALGFLSGCALALSAEYIDTDVCHRIGARPIGFSAYLPDYEEDRAGFHASRRALADAFEASGQ